MDTDITKDSSMLNESSDLASRLGQQGLSTQISQPSIPITVNWAGKANTKADGPPASLRGEVHEDQMLQDIVNPSKVKTVVQFNRACKTFLEITGKSQPALSSRTTSASLILKNIVERQMDKKSFWPKMSLLSLIKDCHIPASSCTEFVLLAIALNDLEVVDCSINHMQDIPDSILTRSLQFYIRYFQADVNGGGQHVQDDEMPPATSQFSLTCSCPQYVNRILCCPFNDTFIVDHLKQFSFDEALVLLRYLHYLLSTTPASHQDDSVPTLHTVADWISALLDAHFTQLLLSHEARALLSDLAQSVQTQEMFYTELEAVQTILESFSNSAQVPIKQTSGSYSIEVLTM